MIAVYFVLGYLALGLLLLCAVAFIRRGCKREGPFVSPNGDEVWIIWNDPLATKLGGDNRAYTTIVHTIGANELATKAGAVYYMLGHECSHITGLLLAIVILPAYVALSWLGHSSPFEVPAYGIGDHLRKLPGNDPVRVEWEEFEDQVNATRPV